jgi:hypothetical protein
LIPQASSEGSKQVCLTIPLSFDKVLDVIHKIIGCADVAHKLNLAWKLSISTQKVKPIDLCSDKDWAGCLEDVAAAERKKKNQAVPVMIVVDDQVGANSACTFRMHLLSLPVVYEFTSGTCCDKEEAIQG